MIFKSKTTKRRKIVKLNERFATRVVIVVGITTALFIIAQYISFLVTGMEQTAIKYFDAVVIECGALMLKRIAEVIVARIKKKEGLEPEESEDI